VMRTLREMGIASVAVYSEADREALHVRRADEAYLLGPGPATESYLKIDKLIEVAKEAGAEAIHPGYGFLAENADFARACAEAGIVFVGPPAEAIEAMGSKTRARELMREAGVPIVPGTTEVVENVEAARKIIDTARQAGATAIHPGYGFLAENADFARACAEAEITFIGPPAEAIEAMGSKTRAREIMAEAGVPIVPGATSPAADLEEAGEQAEAAGYPVACKAAGGGGGKGFRVAIGPDELADAFEGAAREGEKFFSDSRVYIERYLEDPRHVEIQVLADSHGNVVHLGERDCSIQRRHQKLIEEAPGPRVDAEMRERIGAIAVEAARAVGYRSAGTVEGLQHEDEYFFLEMNTRVQVEHCVTEMVTGIDIVREQVKVAAGEELSVSQQQVDLRGHSIECRINAEAAHKKFAPAPGTITHYLEPAGPGVRVDSGVVAGSKVTPMYDPMVAKLIVWDVDREHATRRMLRALGEFEIGGLTTLIPFHRALLATEQWARAETCRDLIADRDWLKATAAEAAPAAQPAEAEAGVVERDYKVEVGGKLFDVKVIGEGVGQNSGAGAGPRQPQRRQRKGAGAGGASSEALPSPLRGTVLRVAVEQGAEVSEGDLICVIEAMKMENEITAHRSGAVAELGVSEGSSVSSGDVIAVIK
ncbi:MAG TPA: biotin carboxylase N-terminal domain-containing protein, partial [Solirubrobacterales bacterium]|nr:biotin carboxylase N-terminal domain-containing protein [Solirubrobacterales bacterium]